MSDQQGFAPKVDGPLLCSRYEAAVAMPRVTCIHRNDGSSYTSYFDLYLFDMSHCLNS